MILIIKNRNKINSEDFKIFYHNELKTNEKIQEYLVQRGKIDLLKEMLKDVFYSYNDNYIIKYIEQTLKNKELGMSTQDNELKYIFKILSF